MAHPSMYSCLRDVIRLNPARNDHNSYQNCGFSEAVPRRRGWEQPPRAQLHASRRSMDQRRRCLDSLLILTRDVYSAPQPAGICIGLTLVAAHVCRGAAARADYVRLQPCAQRTAIRRLECHGYSPPLATFITHLDQHGHHSFCYDAAA